MPFMFTPQIPADVSLALAEELHANASSLEVNTEHHGSDARYLITILANEFADRVIIDTSTDITRVLHHCLKLEALEACVRIIRRLETTSSQATPETLERVLIPLISTLRELTLSHTGLTGDINILVQVIFMRWTAVVLGPKPAQDLSAFTFLANWTCACSTCEQAKDFLRKPSLEPSSLCLYRIGAPLRRHVEECFYGSADLLATTTTIRTSSPQGLQVRFPPCTTTESFELTPRQISFKDTVKAPLVWEVKRKKGLQMLRDITKDENELQVILGTRYQIILQVLEANRVNERSQSTPSDFQQSAAADPGPSGSGPLAKKRKRDPTDTIDLT